MFYSAALALLLAVGLAGALSLWWFRDRRCRVLLVGEGPRAMAKANELLYGPTAKECVLVGWLLDSRRKAANRFQQFGQFEGDRQECLKLAALHGIPTYDGSIHTPEFRCWLKGLGGIDLALMAGFGWRVTRELIDYVNGWWLNTHPSPKWHRLKDVEWPNKYRGPQPYQGMIVDDEKEVGIVLHAIDEQWDEGVFIAQSEGRPMWKHGKPKTQAEVAAFLVSMHKQMAEPSVVLFRRLAGRIRLAIRWGLTPAEFAASLPECDVLQQAEPQQCSSHQPSTV